MRELPVVSNWTCMGDAHCCQGPLLRMTPAEWDELRAVRPDLQGETEGASVLLRGSPCPLLTSDNRCSVYDVRPMNCRRFMCLRVKGEEFIPSDEAHLGCANLYVRLTHSRSARSQFRRNQKKAQAWGLAHGWTETMT